MQATLTLLFLSNRTHFHREVIVLCDVGCVHGRSAVLTMAVALVNYLCCKLLAGYRVAPALFWILNCSLYFAREGVEHGTGYFSWLSWYCYSYIRHFKILTHRFAEYKPGLKITFAWPYSLCRMISFSMDYHWAKIKRDSPRKDQENKLAIDPIVSRLITRFFLMCAFRILSMTIKKKGDMIFFLTSLMCSFLHYTLMDLSSHTTTSFINFMESSTVTMQKLVHTQSTAVE